MASWRRLPGRRRVGVLALVLIGVGWFLVPGILWPLALLLVMVTNIYLDIREDRDYLRAARARDLNEGEPR